MTEKGRYAGAGARQITQVHPATQQHSTAYCNMSQPRPKPWETASTATTAVSPTGSTPLSTTTTTSTSTTNPSANTADASSRPAVPPIPSSMVDKSTQNSITNSSNITNGLSGYGSSSYGMNGMGSSMYGGYGSYGSGYGSGYGGYGSYGGMGGMGGLGGMSSYGGMSGLGGYGGYGGLGGMGGRYRQMGYGGVAGEENSSGSLNGVADATARTFQVLENVVYAVGAVAALLESTYYATHNSFFTILGVADQLGHLGSVGGMIKDTFGGVTDSVKQIGNGASGSNNGPLGLYAVLAWLKRILKKLLGFSTASPTDSSVSGSHALLQEFSNWKNGLISNNPSSKSKNSKLSLKPLLVFLLALVGLPVLMSKFVRYIEREQQRRVQGPDASISAGLRADNTTATNADQSGHGRSNKIDPRSLEFARAVYDFIPEREEEQPNGWKELKLGRGDLVAILSNLDGWSHCRARDGRVGYVPTHYLEVIKRAEKTGAIADSPAKEESSKQTTVGKSI